MLLAKVQPRCRELGMELRAVLLGDLTPPPELASQIKKRDVARVNPRGQPLTHWPVRGTEQLKSIETLKQQKHDIVEAKNAPPRSRNRIRSSGCKWAPLKLQQDLENARFVWRRPTTRQGHPDQRQG